MSADNWTQCPRCLAKADVELQARQAEVDEAYGKIPLEDFDRMRYKLEYDAAKLQEDQNFRENWQITGVSGGVVSVEYRGSCTKCNFKVEFDHEHQIPEMS